MKYAAVSLNFDSLSESYGFPHRYRDPSFFEVSDRFLKLAEKYNFKYSIYMIGKDLQRDENRKRVKEWVAQGHEIGNHSWTHLQNFATLGKAGIYDEVKMAHDIITETVGYPPKGFIAPSWATSRELIKVLIDLDYIYDTSEFPSWLMFPVVLKMLLNHIGDKRFSEILRRKDFLYNLFGPRDAYRSEGSLFKNRDDKGITILPLPTNRYRISCWHTLVFMFGWKVHEMILRSCLKTVDAFYYVIHPADLICESDLSGGNSRIERLMFPLNLKQYYLEKSIETILASGRKIVTMRELAAKVI